MSSWKYLPSFHLLLISEVFSVLAKFSSLMPLLYSVPVKPITTYSENITSYTDFCYLFPAYLISVYLKPVNSLKPQQKSFFMKGVHTNFSLHKIPGVHTACWRHTTAVMFFLPLLVTWHISVPARLEVSLRVNNLPCNS